MTLSQTSLLCNVLAPGTSDDWSDNIGHDIYKRIWRLGTGLIIAVFCSSLYSWRNQGSETRVSTLRDHYYSDGTHTHTPHTHTRVQGSRARLGTLKACFQGHISFSKSGTSYTSRKQCHSQGTRYSNVRVCRRHFLLKSPWVPSCHTTSPELRSPELWAN